MRLKTSSRWLFIWFPPSRAELKSEQKSSVKRKALHNFSSFLETHKHSWSWPRSISDFKARVFMNYMWFLSWYNVSNYKTQSYRTLRPMKKVWVLALKVLFFHFDRPSSKPTWATMARVGAHAWRCRGKGCLHCFSLILRGILRFSFLFSSFLFFHLFKTRPCSIAQLAWE